MPEPARRQLVLMQFEAQAAGYAAEWPGHAHDIVTLAGAPVGQQRVHRGAEALHLIDISLGAASRGRGLGTALLRALQDEAAARGLPLRLAVMQGNPAARLYARLGFVPVGDRGLHTEMEWRVS